MRVPAPLASLPNVEVVCARAEEYATGSGRDAYGTALARALAPPPVAVEWCLPLVRPGGRLILLTTEAARERRSAAAAEASPAARLAPSCRAERRRLLVFAKTGPTPERFPRRPGVARKRPLA